jgi:hypothetical protein
MKKKKKTMAKRYEMKRKDIRDALKNIKDKLSAIDTCEDAPYDVANTIDEIYDDIGDLQLQIFDEI